LTDNISNEVVELKMPIRYLAGLFLLLFLQACINQGTLITGQEQAAIDEQSVRVYLNERPDCDFEVVGLMDLPGGFFHRARLIDAFRSKAAAMGATAVQVTFVQKIGASEYKGSARALRCLVDN